jgi:hypothetical protein
LGPDRRLHPVRSSAKGALLIVAQDVLGCPDIKVGKCTAAFSDGAQGLSKIQSGARQLVAELEDALRESLTGEAVCDPGAERLPRIALVADHIAEDLSDFLFQGVAVTAGAKLQLGLHVVVEMSNQELSHDKGTACILIK